MYHITDLLTFKHQITWFTAMQKKITLNYNSITLEN